MSKALDVCPPPTQPTLCANPECEAFGEPSPHGDYAACRYGDKCGIYVERVDGKWCCAACHKPQDSEASR